MADYGLKVSEAGYDVKTATDEHLILKSDQTLLKTYSYGSISLTSDVTIAHNLGYVPQFLVFIYDGTNSYLATGNTSYGVARADSSNIYIRNDGTSARYYIFYEQA